MPWWETVPVSGHPGVLSTSAQSAQSAQSAHRSHRISSKFENNWVSRARSHLRNGEIGHPSRSLRKGHWKHVEITKHVGSKLRKQIHKACTCWDWFTTRKMVSPKFECLNLIEMVSAMVSFVTPCCKNWKILSIFSERFKNDSYSDLKNAIRKGNQNGCLTFKKKWKDWVRKRAWTNLHETSKENCFFIFHLATSFKEFNLRTKKHTWAQYSK